MAAVIIHGPASVTLTGTGTAAAPIFMRQYGIDQLAGELAQYAEVKVLNSVLLLPENKYENEADNGARWIGVK